MLRSHSPTLLYSYLSASIGSTRMARRAGMYTASIAVAVRIAATAKSVAPSFAETPYTRLLMRRVAPKDDRDRKSTRLNSSHVEISYAVFCLKKKKTKKETNRLQ